MSRKTRTNKRSRAKKISNRKAVGWFAKFDLRTRIVAGMALCALLAGVAYAHWQASSIENLTAPDNRGPSNNAPTSPVKSVSILSQSELAEIPPEALHPQPPAPGGYNASSGGLPPGALPPGVVLPGVPQGGRTTAQGYGMYDGVRQQFTGKERDNETGLDYFGARYYSSTQGRFTSVDPENAGADPSDPQSWNGYAYARNNPLKYTDPNGQEYVVCNAEGKSCVKYSDDEFYRIRRESQEGYGFTGNRDFFESGAITQNGETIATYRQTSIDDQASQYIFAIRRNVAPIPKATALFAGVSAALGVTGGAALYALQPMTVTVRTLGLETTPEVAPAALDGVSSATTRAFERQLEQHGRAALEKSLRSLERRLAEHLTKLEQARKASGFTSSMEREISTFQRSIDAIKTNSCEEAMNERMLLCNQADVIALADRLSKCPEVTKYDHGDEKEAGTLAHAFGDLEQSFRRFLEEQLPRLMNDQASCEESYDALLDIGEEFRHILYHIYDTEFYSYLRDQSDA